MASLRPGQPLKIHLATVAGILLLGTWSVGLTTGKWWEPGRGPHPGGGTHVASASGSRIVADCCPPLECQRPNLAPEVRCQQSLFDRFRGSGRMEGMVASMSGIPPPWLIPSGFRPVAARLECIRRSPSGPGSHPPVDHPPDGSLPVGLESGSLVQPHLWQNVKSDAVRQRRPHDNPEMTPDLRSYLRSTPDRIGGYRFFRECRG